MSQDVQHLACAIVGGCGELDRGLVLAIGRVGQRDVARENPVVEVVAGEGLSLELEVGLSWPAMGSPGWLGVAEGVIPTVKRICVDGGAP